MLRRITLATTQRRLTGALASQRCVRQYSSETGSDGKSPKGDKEAGASGPLGSNMLKLLNDLGTAASKPAAAPRASTEKYSSLLNRNSGGDALLAGDFTGSRMGDRFDRTTVNKYLNEDSHDPMSKLILHVHASSNNTILSLTDARGKVLVNASGGSVGFKKAQRAGFEAAYHAVASIANSVKDKGIDVRKVEVRLKGFGVGRDSAFKAIHTLTNWVICGVADTTPIPFNGCRPKKARRL
ncbi:hypothetical protein GGF46_004119 [Coemansia sp. RSA 552]|nr:hypothetical protein GGF46_004119 [Coemansia sp. RSA 552]